MDGNKQESIDLLLLSNANSGELGQKAQALLEQTDILGLLREVHFIFCLSCFLSSISQLLYQSRSMYVTGGVISPFQRNSKSVLEHGM